MHIIDATFFIEILHSTNDTLKSPANKNEEKHCLNQYKVG